MKRNILKVGFDLTFEVKKCPENRSAVQTFKIHPVGLQESLTIDVTYRCDCDCPQNDVSVSFDVNDTSNVTYLTPVNLTRLVARNACRTYCNFKINIGVLKPMTTKQITYFHYMYNI